MTITKNSWKNISHRLSDENLLRNRISHFIRWTIFDLCSYRTSSFDKCNTFWASPKKRRRRKKKFVFTEAKKRTSSNHVLTNFRQFAERRSIVSCKSGRSTICCNWSNTDVHSRKGKIFCCYFIIKKNIKMILAKISFLQSFTTVIPSDQRSDRISYTTTCCS